MSNLFSLSPFQVVCPFDPSIDKDCDLVKYAEIRDMSLIRPMSGEVLTVYYVRRLPQSTVLRMLQTSSNESTKHAVAFMTSVIRVDNMTMPDGSRINWEPEWVKPSADAKSEIMKDHEVDLFAMDEILDIGSVAYERAFLRRGRPVCFVPPQSSGFALGKLKRHFLLVDQEIQSKKQEEPKEQQQNQSSSHGVTHGNVNSAEERAVMTHSSMDQKG